MISLGGIVALEAVRVGSFDIDAAIQTYIRREYGIAIGERTAEEIKVADRLGRPDRRREQGRGARPGPDERAAARRSCSAPRRCGGAIEEVVSSIIESVIRCLGQGPARARRRTS